MKNNLENSIEDLIGKKKRREKPTAQIKETRNIDVYIYIIL